MFILRGVLVPKVCVSLVELLRCTVFSTVLSMSSDAVKHVSKEQLSDLTTVMESLLTTFRTAPMALPLPDQPLTPALVELASADRQVVDVDSGVT